MPPPRAYPRVTGGPPPRHKPSPSDEERRRQQGKPRPGPNELNIFADPAELPRPRHNRPQRRNSETSVREKPREMDPEAEKRRRERKLRESKDASRPTKGKKPNARLDVIDKLDVTSIYGTGCGFSTLHGERFTDFFSVPP